MDIPAVDVLWILLSASLVFLMQAGFLCLETGVTRQKNNINVAVKNLTDLGISIILFWAFGFAIMFGQSWAGFLGHTSFLTDFSQTTVWAVAFFLFQMMFCGTTVTILSGAVAERMRFDGYIVLAMLVSGIIYPVFGHWVWNGLDVGGAFGWLGQLGFVDFAGSTVVHSVGGWVALATLLILGPRTGRFAEDGTPQKIQGANLSIAVLGVILLWFGWFGFNGGSTLAMNDQVPYILANTMLAGGAGLVGALLIGWYRRGRADVDLALNGSIAGLVAITANAHAVSSPSAVLIGLIGGMIMLLVEELLLRWQIDDAVGAIPVHLGAGVWGTLAVALFGQAEMVGTGLGFWAQLGVQCLGIIVCGGWAFGTTYLLLQIINRWLPLRVSVEAEKVGLNVSEHGATTPLIDLFQVMDAQSRTGDLSLRVPVEPFTEVGQIAERYNNIITSLEQMTSRTQNLERLNRLKDEFLANTSHELRTPINGIVGLTESLLDGAAGPLSAEQSNNLSLVTHSGRRLARLIDDILDFSKLKHQALTLRIKPLYLYPLADIVVALSQPLLEEKSIELINRVSPELPPIYGDEDRVQQILHNLVANGIKFTNQGSVTISAEVDDNKVVIYVRDTGIGIPPDKLEQIFQPFEQADGSVAREYGGTGLGLTVTQQLIRLHGGEIAVESAVREGTCFSFTLPIADELPAADVETETEPVKRKQDILPANYTAEAMVLDDEHDVMLEPLEESYHILVVDDEAVNRRVLINHLSLQRYTVTEAKNGQEALNLIYSQNGNPFNLVILDVMMPRMSGYDVCREIRQYYPPQELPIILLTAKYQISSLVNGFKVGANDYLTKPFYKAELLVRIQNHLQLSNLRELNASKDRFFSIVAHDVRAPFSPLLGLTELLSETAYSADRQNIKEMSVGIHRAAQSIYSLLTNLLEWSRLQGGRMPYNPTRFDLQELVEKTCDLLNPQAEQKGITLQNQVSPHLFVLADKNMTYTIIRNLMTNALKFTPSEGQVQITAAAAKEMVAEGEIAFAEIAVTDTGVGISPEDQEKLFKIDVHHSTKGTSKEGGTGLGLIICQDMVQRHGGRIWVQSQLLQGTSIKFTLPLDEATLTRPQKGKRPQTPESVAAEYLRGGKSSLNNPQYAAV